MSEPMMLGPYVLDTIITGDARELAQVIPDASIDVIYTDPPYDYEHIALWSWLSLMASRILKPTGFLLTYVADAFFQEVLTRLCTYMDFYWLCTIFQPGINARYHPKHIIKGFRPVFLLRQQHTQTKSPYIPDALSTAFGGKAYHPWQQHELPARVWLRYLCPSEGIILDPFCGGGTVPSVCKQLNRRYLSFEIVPNTAERARERVRLTQPPLPFDEPEQLSLEASA